MKISVSASFYALKDLMNPKGSFGSFLFHIRRKGTFREQLVMLLHSEPRNAIYSSRGDARAVSDLKLFSRTAARNVLRCAKMSVATVPVRLTIMRSSRNTLDYGISWHSNFLKN